MTKFRLAAAQYPIDELVSFTDYAAKITAWVEEAARAGAGLLVFPEYAAMELARLAGAAIAQDLFASAAAMQAPLEEAGALHAALAKRCGVYILGGSAPVRGANGAYRNTARIFSPTGAIGAQQKQIMTRFERETWNIEPGEEQTLFQTPLAQLGVAICYDVEFPQCVRNLTEAGAQLVLAPSCTDALSGYWRVRIGAQARALENQCIVIQAPTVGDAPWSPAVDANHGAAGVFGPPDRGFPEDGVLALGAMNTPQWVYADVDLAWIENARANGKVLNHAHWREQRTAPPRRAVL